MLIIEKYIKEIFEDVHILYTMSKKSPKLNFILYQINNGNYVFDCGRVDIYKNDIIIKLKFPLHLTIKQDLEFDKNPCLIVYNNYKSLIGEFIYEFNLKYTENDYNYVLQFIRQILNYYLQ